MNFSWICRPTRVCWQFCAFGALQWQAVDQRVIDCVQVTSWDLCCRSGVNHLTRKHRLQQTSTTDLILNLFTGPFRVRLNPSVLCRVSQKATLVLALEILRPKVLEHYRQHWYSLHALQFSFTYLELGFCSRLYGLCWQFDRLNC